jgi:L-aspartate oxidase
MAQVMVAQGVDHLYLDARSIGQATLERRFPTVLAGCRAAGVDPVTQPVPVRPAQHYTCGGVAADLDGRTSLPGLAAVGEVACTGVHGANRLASNSLLEGLVAGRNTAQALRDDLPARRRPAPTPDGSASVLPQVRQVLARAVQTDAGVLRDPSALAGLASLLGLTAPLPDRPDGPPPGVPTWEATNLHALSTVLVAAASAREESRGCHRRTDITEPCDPWAVHLDTVVVPADGPVAETRTAREAQTLEPATQQGDR